MTVAATLGRSAAPTNALPAAMDDGFKRSKPANDGPDGMLVDLASDTTAAIERAESHPRDPTPMPRSSPECSVSEATRRPMPRPLLIAPSGTAASKGERGRLTRIMRDGPAPVLAYRCSR